MNLERANWTLDPTRDWHVRWFHESLRIIDRFTHQERRGNLDVYGTGTNLCHYVRCTTLWPAAILALQLVMVASVVGALVLVPVHLFGVGGLIRGYVTIAVILTGFGTLFWLADLAERNRVGKKVLGFLDRWFVAPVSNITKAAAKRTGAALSFRNQEGVSLWSMVWTMIVTLKHKVCPLITIATPEVAKETE